MKLTIALTVCAALITAATTARAERILDKKVVREIVLEGEVISDESSGDHAYLLIRYDGNLYSCTVLVQDGFGAVEVVLCRDEKKPGDDNE